MRCTVYYGQGELILVPDSEGATREAEARYGPLRSCGGFDTARLGPPVADDVEEALADAPFAPLPPSLALLLSFTPTRHVPLPPGFSWKESDWWEGADTLVLQCTATAPAATVALIECVRTGCWRVTTNANKAWLYVSKHITGSRLAAIQFLVGWTERNGPALIGEAVRH